MKTIKEYVETLSEEERTKFSYLIDECLTRENDILLSEKQSLYNIKCWADNIIGQLIDEHCLYIKEKMGERRKE